MKPFSMFVCCALSASLFGQSGLQPDTLLVEKFLEDPSENMLDFPTGNDEFWINFDQDGFPAVGGFDRNWFWEYDLGDTSSVPTNSCFTSFSYLENGKKNRNWLITPPVEIPDTNYWFCWRSMPFNGPAYMDGYKVLVSTTQNEASAANFKDTLFVAAENTDILTADPQSVDLKDFKFSKGYIHAKSFTDTSYFYLIEEVDENGDSLKFYQGRLEPHVASLKKFAGKTVYIAILHDSYDDYVLQIDDLVIAKNKSSDTQQLAEGLHRFTILPNIAQNGVYVRVEWLQPQEFRLRVVDPSGKVFLDQSLSKQFDYQYYINAESWPSGYYFCNIATRAGVETRKFLKL